MRIPVRDLSLTDRGELIRILVMCGYTVKLSRIKLTEKGQRLPFVEFWDGKEIKQDE